MQLLTPALIVIALICRMTVDLILKLPSLMVKSRHSTTPTIIKTIKTLQVSFVYN